MTPPFGRLEYLYVGTADLDRDLKWYRDVLGAELMWQFEDFGAKVAALRVGEGPYWILADHRPAGTCMPIWLVADLKAAAEDLKARGWVPDAGPVEVPDGPVYVFKDPTGNPLAILEPKRPHALDTEWDRNPDNRHAIRE